MTISTFAQHSIDRALRSVAVSECELAARNQADALQPIAERRRAVDEMLERLTDLKTSNRAIANALQTGTLKVVNGGGVQADPSGRMPAESKDPTKPN
jgi:hypothetical protein